MIDIEESLAASLRARAGGDVPTDPLVAGALSRGRAWRARRRAALVAVGAAVVTLGAATVPGLLNTARPGGPPTVVSDGGPAALAPAPEVPTALEDPAQVGTDPGLVHFSADGITAGARVVRWHSGALVEALVAEVGPARLVHVDIGPDLARLDGRVREGEVTGTGTTTDTTVGGRPATLQRIPTEGADGDLAWVLRWQPVTGLWARVASYGPTDEAVRRAAAAVRFDEVRRCAVPFTLTALPLGAGVLSCELSVMPNEGSVDASLVVGVAEDVSMQVQIQYTPGRGGSRKTANTTVGGRAAFAYPGGDELELLGYEDSYVSVRIGKGYRGYDMAEARRVSAGLRMADPGDPTTWPDRLVRLPG
jgi:hypothetical protein